MRVRLMAMLLVVLACAPAMAQDTPRVEVGVGYAYMRDKELDESFPLGWYADIAGNLNHWLGLVGEVGGSYKTVDFLGDDLKLSVHTFLGGLRLARRGDGSTAYVQLLAGGAQSKADILGQSDKQTDLALQPGVGLDLRMSDGMALRIGGDFRRIYGDKDIDGNRTHTDEWRATAGLVFRVGR